MQHRVGADARRRTHLDSSRADGFGPFRLERVLDQRQFRIALRQRAGQHAALPVEKCQPFKILMEREGVDQERLELGRPAGRIFLQVHDERQVVVQGNQKLAHLLGMRVGDAAVKSADLRFADSGILPGPQARDGERKHRNQKQHKEKALMQSHGSTLLTMILSER